MKITPSLGPPPRKMSHPRPDKEVPPAAAQQGTSSLLGNGSFDGGGPVQPARTKNCKTKTQKIEPRGGNGTFGTSSSSTTSSTMSQTSSYTLLELFCGVGGMRYGLQYAGVEIDAANSLAADINEHALEVYRHNFLRSEEEEEEELLACKDDGLHNCSEEGARPASTGTTPEVQNDPGTQDYDSGATRKKANKIKKSTNKKKNQRNQLKITVASVDLATAKPEFFTRQVVCNFAGVEEGGNVDKDDHGVVLPRCLRGVDKIDPEGPRPPGRSKRGGVERTSTSSSQHLQPAQQVASQRCRYEIWTMSPPCQPFTRQGNQEHGADDRCGALKNIVSVLRFLPDHLLPRFLLLENVVGFEKSRICQELVEVLISRRFQVCCYFLSPDEFGFPNSRQRFFLVAERKGTSPVQQEDALPDNATPIFSGGKSCPREGWSTAAVHVDECWSQARMNVVAREDEAEAAVALQQSCKHDDTSMPVVNMSLCSSAEEALKIRSSVDLFRRLDHLHRKDLVVAAESQGEGTEQEEKMNDQNASLMLVHEQNQNLGNEQEQLGKSTSSRSELDGVLVVDRDEDQEDAVVDNYACAQRQRKKSIMGPRRGRDHALLCEGALQRERQQGGEEDTSTACSSARLSASPRAGPEQTSCPEHEEQQDRRKEREDESMKKDKIVHSRNRTSSRTGFHSPPREDGQDGSTSKAVDLFDEGQQLGEAEASERTKVATGENGRPQVQVERGAGHGHHIEVFDLDFSRPETHCPHGVELLKKARSCERDYHSDQQPPSPGSVDGAGAAPAGFRHITWPASPSSTNMNCASTTSTRDVGASSSSRMIQMRSIADFLLDKNYTGKSKSKSSSVLVEDFLSDLYLSDKTLMKRAAWTLDVVYPSCQHSMCVTKAYGRYFTGTGSVLYCGQQPEPPIGCGGAARSCDEGAGGAGAGAASSSSSTFPQRRADNCLHDRRFCDVTTVDVGNESRSPQANENESNRDLTHQNMEDLDVREDTRITTEPNNTGAIMASDVALVAVSSAPASQKSSTRSTGTALVENATTPAAICSPQAKEMLSKFGNQRLRYFHPLEVFKLMGFPCGQTQHELEVEGHNMQLGLQRQNRSKKSSSFQDMKNKKERTHRSKNYHVFSLPQAISNRQAWGLAGNSLNPRVVGYLVEAHFDFF
ncbi:unnamed protein product [Amoebophrya sp. A120]|nr:unnamed protein product [Amoebophrya sp. A120]|eukprot:GSA120T00007310001.1